MTTLVAFPVALLLAAAIAAVLCLGDGEWPRNRGEWAQAGAALAVIGMMLALIAGGLADLAGLFGG
jgi:uncharacterized membrane protein